MARFTKLDDGGYLVDLNGHLLVKLDKDCLPANYKEWDSIATCSAPIFDMTTNGRDIMYINKGLSHKLTFYKGRGNMTWEGYETWKQNTLPEIILEGITLAIHNSTSGMNWVEMHCYPIPLWGNGTIRPNPSLDTK